MLPTVWYASQYISLHPQCASKKCASASRKFTKSFRTPFFVRFASPSRLPYFPSTRPSCRSHLSQEAFRRSPPRWSLCGLQPLCVPRGLRPHGYFDLFPSRCLSFASFQLSRATPLRLSPSLRTSYLVLDPLPVSLTQSHRPLLSP